MHLKYLTEHKFVLQFKIMKLSDKKELARVLKDKYAISLENKNIIKTNPKMT